MCPNRHRAPDRGRAAGDPLKGIKGLFRRTALAGIAMLPAVLPAAMRAAASAEPDPIFAAIEVHRKAKAAAAAAFAEVERLTTIADAEVGPRSLPVLNMVQPGRFKEFVDVTSWIDIDQLVPAEIYPDENAHFRERLRRQQEDHDAIVGDTDEITDEPCAVLWTAIDDFAETVPTTMAGLLAMILYADEIWQQEEAGLLIANMATAARALVGGRA